jgi:hypothetical protein
MSIPTDLKVIVSEPPLQRPACPREHYGLLRQDRRIGGPAMLITVVTMCGAFCLIAANLDFVSDMGAILGTGFITLIG